MKSSVITPTITERKDASLKMYFRDISKLPLIDSEEEIELTKRIKQGDQKAMSKLVNANLRFVISIAKQYQNRGVDLVDLIQEGNCGLIQAATLFDESRGIKFISYAVWWIRQAIIKAVSDNSKTVRMPVNQIQNKGKLYRAANKFEQENGRQPSILELEEITGLDVKKIYTAYNYGSKSVSLESPTSTEDNFCLLDVIPNDVEPTDSNLCNGDVPRVVLNLLKSLPYRDQDMLRMAFGIGMAPMTYYEIADRFGVTYERVRQLLHKIIKNLQENYKDKLHDILGEF